MRMAYSKATAPRRPTSAVGSAAHRERRLSKSRSNLGKSLRNKRWSRLAGRISSMTSPFHRSISAIAYAMVFTARCAAAEVIPQELAVESNGGAVAVTRYAAEGMASRPAVLVVHGAGGLDVDPQDYARLVL